MKDISKNKDSCFKDNNENMFKNYVKNEEEYD